MAQDALKVHRDVAAGIIASALIKEGYYGEDIELFGSVCTLDGKNIAVYGYDQEAVAMRAYAYLQKGAHITHIVTKSYHLEKLNEDKTPKEIDFLSILENGLKCETEMVPNEGIKFIWSGFAYKENGTQKVLVNGYFPYVLENYLKLSEQNIPVGKIEFRIFDSVDFEREKVKAELKEFLAQSKL